MGNARKLNFPNFKKINCSVLRLSKLKDYQVSNIISKSSFALFFHNDGLSIRSGILSTCFQHGLPSIGLKGPNTERSLEDIAGLKLFNEEDIGKGVDFVLDLIINKEKYKSLSKKLRGYYLKERSWEKLRIMIDLEK